MLTFQRYEMPATLPEALALCADAPAGTRLVAGATDILPWAREGRAGDVDLPLGIETSAGSRNSRATNATGGACGWAPTPSGRISSTTRSLSAGCR
ncbi:hypothetical protein [Rhodovulum sp.]|uniref:hypothetical protein n=1 Tax=Rhodovulum sp. TaxID=34009 RepID=UPI00257C9D32|nr:hypothetical protein [Rhodovulum sp.]